MIVEDKFTLNGNYKWVDELPHLVSDYNARKHRQATRRCNSRDRRKTFGYGVQRDKNRWSSKIQSGSSHEQVQDSFWKELHAKLDHQDLR